MSDRDPLAEVIRENWPAGSTHLTNVVRAFLTSDETVERAEAALAAEWHDDQCGCDAWPGGCKGLEFPHPPLAWTATAVLSAATETRS